MQQNMPRLVIEGGAVAPATATSRPITLAAETLHARSAAALCNEAVEGVSTPVDRALLIAAAAQKIEELFDVLRVDHQNDHNTRDTPRRVAKMFVEEIFRGRYSAPPQITEFENPGRCDQLIVSGPIEVRSTCAHHMMPIYGHAIVGVLPSPEGKIIGLSKYDRIIEYFSSRLQIQEELVAQIGSYIMDITQPRGVAVRISAVHMCKTHRGVRASHRSRMVSSVFYGELRDDPERKREFLHECLGLETASA